MKNQTLPPDQSPVLFTDKAGVTREGRYVSDMKAFVEIATISPEVSSMVQVDTPKDCSNVYPEDEIVQWENIEGKSPDEGVIAVL